LLFAKIKLLNESDKSSKKQLVYLNVVAFLLFVRCHHSNRLLFWPWKA